MRETINVTTKTQLHFLINDAFTRLTQFKKEDDKQSFDQVMKELIPGITRYIATWLKRTVKNNKIPAGKYKVADFVDELYIQSYDHFHEVKTSNNLRSWLFKKADELLDDTEIEEEFDEFFFKNIDNYTKGEWEEMEEKYSTDGGGDLLMLEELDDSSYPHNDYVLEDVFIEDKDKEIIDKLDKKLSKEKVNHHIDMMLNRLPIAVRTVFDLAVKENFELDEIATIKRMPTQEVEQYLSYAKENIQLTFEKRYLRNLLGS